MLAHGADRLEEPEWESGSFFFVKIKCLPRNRMLTDIQKFTKIQNVCRETKNTHRKTAYLQETELLPRYRIKNFPITCSRRLMQGDDAGSNREEV